MSICKICGCSFYDSGTREHIWCESCRSNSSLAEGIKKIMNEVEYVQKKYNVDAEQALDIIKLYSIRDALDSIYSAINNINPY